MREYIVWQQRRACARKQSALPIYKNGNLVGAAGASGGSPQQDEDAIRAGITSANLAAAP